VAVLSTDAIKLAANEIGLDGLKSRLQNIQSIQSAKSIEDVTRDLIATAYQSTSNSSDATEDAARVLAESLGIGYHKWSVDSMIEQYQQAVSNATGVSFNWKQHDVVLQNIQARARGPAIWMLANLRNHLLLATSNRSEAAVGYATMDGDTCGGLSPIAGIDKAYLRKWLEWREKNAPQGLSSVPQLSRVNKIPPTAELRPREFHQTDETDLMPYDVLDVIERAAIRDKKSPVDVLATLAEDYSQYSDEDRRKWVARFFTLWCRNQWKRERYAPGFHLDDESLDPKTWCRFPILSGAFTEELKELDVK
jgi:NAD+ synthase (glutamine-hydrolysing)